ncbi:MAG: LuxR family transcriptional regulator [Myxococcales bacterium]|nr:LuxR family transcriptional regulator [Myxococcales bacterium]
MVREADGGKRELRLAGVEQAVDDRVHAELAGLDRAPGDHQRTKHPSYHPPILQGHVFEPPYGKPKRPIVFRDGATSYAREQRMANPSTRISDRVRDVIAGLDVLHIDGPAAVPAALPEIRQLTELDSLLCVCPIERSRGWFVERFDTDNFSSGARFKSLFLAFFDDAPRRYAWYDAVRPEPSQRNVAIDALDIIPAGEYEQSAIYAQVMRPVGLHRHRQPRALLCDGPSLLAWFGGFHDQRVTRRQRRMLSAFLPAIRRRLSIERRLNAAPRLAAALEVALEQLGAPAFVIDGAGRVHETNSAGSALLATRPTEVSAALRACIARAPTPLPFELTPVAQRGTAMHWLAILRESTADARIVEAVSAAATRWMLTPRQRTVLEQVLRGEATTTIAATLGVSERAVEQHISAMFVRAEVANRAALVVAVLLAD